MTLVRTDQIQNPYKFLVWRSAALNTGNGAYAVMACDTKVYDTGSNVDIVTNKGRFTAPVAGFYVFSGMAVATVAADNGRLLVGILKNGTIYLEGSEPRAGGTNTVLASSFTTPPISLAANDYIEFAIQSDSSAALAVGSATDNWFGGFLLSAT